MSDMKDQIRLFTFNYILVNRWSLLFQKGTQVRGFAFFSVLWFLKPICVLWPRCIYFFHPQNNAQLLLGVDFFIGRLENFLETLKVASWGRFSELWMNIWHFFILYFLKINKNCSMLPQNHFWVSCDALSYTKIFLGP